MHHITSQKKLFAGAFVIFLALLCASAVTAWSGPPGSPTTCPSSTLGCNPPINAGTGSEAQTINGGTLTMTNSGAFGAPSITAGSGGFCLPGSNPTGGCITAWPSGGSSYFQASAAPSYNTFGGQSSGNATLLTNGTLNAAFGFGSLQSGNTAQSEVAIGVNALSSATSSRNDTAVGTNALSNEKDPNSGGSYNTALGSGTLGSLTYGYADTGLGFDALGAGTTGLFNTGVGFEGGFEDTTGSYNTFIGNQAGMMDSTGAQTNITGSGNIIIGINTNMIPNAAGSNQLNIGNLIFGTGVSSANAVSTGNVGIGTVSPGQKLTVAGTIQSTSGGIEFPDGSVQTTAAGGTTLTNLINWMNATLHGPYSTSGGSGTNNLGYPEVFLIKEPTCGTGLYTLNFAVNGQSVYVCNNQSLDAGTCDADITIPNGETWSFSESPLCSTTLWEIY